MGAKPCKPCCSSSPTDSDAVGAEEAALVTVNEKEATLGTEHGSHDADGFEGAEKETTAPCWVEVDLQAADTEEAGKATEEVEQKAIEIQEAEEEEARNREADAKSREEQLAWMAELRRKEEEEEEQKQREKKQKEEAEKKKKALEEKKKKRREAEEEKKRKADEEMRKHAEAKKLLAEAGENFCKFATSGKAKSIKTLLDAKGDPDEQDSKGRRPLQVAIAAGDASIVKLLLDGKANPNLEGKGIQSGPTYPLHVAARDGLADMADILLEAGADISLKNQRNQTAEMVAEAKKNMQFVTVLRKFQDKQLKTLVK